MEQFRNDLGRRKRDLYLIAALFLLAAGVFAAGHWLGRAGAQAVVYVDGRVQQTISLADDGVYEIATHWGTNQLIIQSHTAKMQEADCPDQLCVKQKAISRQGQTIVCLPHKVVVEITGTQEAQLDGITN